MRNNRTAGHTFERWCMNWWKRLGFSCTTSRYSSREMDDKKVDLCGIEPFNVQCKYVQNINLHTVLSEMPKDKNINLVFHKRKNKGVVVAMMIEDFEKFITPNF